MAVALDIREMDIALIRVQPVALQALGLGNPKARQKHEAHSGERDRVHAVPLGDAQATLLFLPGELTHAFGRVGVDDVAPRGVREEALQC